jgi:hypothetical protein
MYRALYPKEKFPQGHPDLAISLNNLGARQARRGCPVCGAERWLRVAELPRAAAPAGGHGGTAAPDTS